MCVYMRVCARMHKHVHICVSINLITIIEVWVRVKYRNMGIIRMATRLIKNISPSPAPLIVVMSPENFDVP